tara:strand:+ start:229 stop:621 length:393 start_codon:yes stop_codon:yes gene_type:complete
MSNDDLPGLPSLKEVLARVGENPTHREDGKNPLVEAIQSLSDGDKREIAEALRLTIIRYPLIKEEVCVVGDCPIQLIYRGGNMGKVICGNLVRSSLDRHRTYMACELDEEYRPCEWYGQEAAPINRRRRR